MFFRSPMISNFRSPLISIVFIRFSFAFFPFVLFLLFFGRSFGERVDGDSSEGGNPEATGGPAGLGLGPSLQAEEVLGRDDVKAYLRSIQVRKFVFVWMGGWVLR